MPNSERCCENATKNLVQVVVLDEPPLRFLANQSVAQTPASHRHTRAIAFVWPHCNINTAVVKSNVVDDLDWSICFRLALLWASFRQERAFAYPWCSFLSVDFHMIGLLDGLLRRVVHQEIVDETTKANAKKKTNASIVWQLDNLLNWTVCLGLLVMGHPCHCHAISRHSLTFWVYFTVWYGLGH